MRRVRLVAVICLANALSMVCQVQPAGSSDVPDKADVMKFLELTHAKAQMVQVLNGMSKQMRLGAEQALKEKIPNATPEQIAKVDGFCDEIFKSLPIDEMIDAVVPIYQKHLTKTDLAAITDFYSSPTGQKVLKEMPMIMSEAIQAGGDIGRKAMKEKSDELDQKIAELVKQAKSE
jgi:hypothetical protein